MRRVIISAAFLLLLLGASPLPAPGQSLPSKEEATKKLRTVLEQVNLQSLDTPPFHLVANVHYVFPGGSNDARYEIIWSAPDKFRRNFRSGDSIETDTALHDKLYVDRNTPVMTLLLWRLNTLVNAPMALLGTDPKATRVYSAQIGGAGGTCVNSESKVYRNQVCFAADSGQIISFKSEFAELNASPRFELDDFADLGSRRFPRHILRHYDRETLEVHVDTLEPMNEVGGETFISLPAVHPLDWCADPVRRGDPPDPWRSILGVHSARRPFLAYYVFVGSDGRVKNSEPLFPTTPAIESQMSGWFRDARFPILSCAGMPISYEEVYVPPVVTLPPGASQVR